MAEKSVEPDNMATSSNTFCGICEARHITKAADFWCGECDEGLCSACNDHHSISKASKHHNVITIESYNKLPLSISNIVNYCSNHDRRYENYCPHHDTLCCPACIAVDHKSCIGLSLLQDVINPAKTSALLDSIETSVKDLQNNIANIIEDRQQNIVSIHDQRQRYKDEIKQTRAKLNDHLDTIEHDMLKDIDDTEIRTKAEIEQLVVKLYEKKKVADAIEHNISAIKMYASDLNAYIGSKSIETEVEKEETYLQSLIEDGSLAQTRLNLNIDNVLTSLETTFKVFGKVNTLTGRPLVVLKNEKNKQAQIFSTVPQIVPKSFDEITLSQISKITIQNKGWKNYDFRGSVVLPNGKVILADNGNSRLVIVDNKGLLDKSIPCSTDKESPFDVTFIKENVVAVSTSSGIQIININSETVFESIKTAGQCQGIAYNNGVLICCVKSKGIQGIDIVNKTVTTLVNVDERSTQLGIAVHRNKIYSTDFSNDIVSCYELEGKKLWQFKNKEVIFGPAGIAVDNNSYVYVALISYHNSVIVLSPDGKKFRKILSSKDGLFNPRILYFDEAKQNLIVVNQRQPIFIHVYKVS